MIPQPSEHDEAKALIQWRDNAAGRLPMLRDLFAIPNGGNRDGRTGRAMAAEGVAAGIPDYFLPHCCGGWPGLFLELKRRDGGKISPEQRERIERLAAAGYAVAIAAGWWNAALILQVYIAGQWGECEQLAQLDKLPKRRASRAA